MLGKRDTTNGSKINGNCNPRPGIVVHINGTAYQVDSYSIPADTSLNTFLRDHAQLPGTKFMCMEGGCGACIVTATKKDPITKEPRSFAINSCLTPIYKCDGYHITTVEGIGNTSKGYHPVQKRLVEHHGSQCGYCSPGMVMNMFSLLEAKDGKLTKEEIENSFGGNICRCTGYRPILDAFKSFANDEKQYKKICLDIEDLPKQCPNTGDNCNGRCTNYEKLICSDHKVWHKPNTISDIFDIWEDIKDSRYMLVAGNTAHGVYRRDTNIKHFIDIKNVEELQQYSIKDSEVVIGGNISLTDMMEILRKASKRTGFEYCEEVWNHIDLIANVPVRNAGTIAGNLSIKYAQNEFPSDLFLVLLAINAKIVIASQRDSKWTLSLKEYLAVTDMNKKIILEIILFPLNPEKFKFKSYKIMPRAQNAHAYVNAAFLFETNSNIVKSCNICYGGISSEFMTASQTEEFLIGKNLYSSEIVRAAIQLLSQEIVPEPNPLEASVEYRKTLALSLFYKFILFTCPENILKPELKSGGTILERPLSSGLQVYDTNESRWPLTKPIQKVEGLIQCSGEAQYVNDVPHQSGELWAAFVPASVVHARILAIDPSEALQMPGVRHFFSAKDIPGANNFAAINLGMADVEEVFCSGETKFYGQPIGMILAESFQMANQAVGLVQVQYERTDKTIASTIKEVYQREPQRIQTATITKVAQNKGNDIVKSIKGHFEIGGQYHYTMEPQTTVCIPSEDGLDVYCSTQWVDLIQIAISAVLKMPENSINLHLRRIGGGYGAKISRGSQIACACALGSKLTNRTVRFVLSMESNMTIIGKRYGMISDYEVQVNKDGKIQSLTNNVGADLGCSSNENPLDIIAEFFPNCYNNDTWSFVGKPVITDSAKNTWCRAPGTTEGIANIETIIEHISREIHLDPIQVRLANIPETSEMKTHLENFLEITDYKNRKSQIDNYNLNNRWRKRGIAIVPMKYPQGFFGAIPVMVSIFHTDGTVAVTHGGVECGQGMNTKVAQVVAYTLQIPIEYIKIKPSVNYVTPNSGVTGGSMTSEAVCYAAMKACETLLERMKPIREQMPNAKWHEITDACYKKLIELSCTYQYKQMDLKKYNIWGVSCAEIEVDMLTGNFQLNRVDILEDTGESMNPAVDVGQIEGAFVMGLGYWLTENLIYDQQTGELLTNCSWNYKPPGAKDIPIDFRIHFLRNSPNRVSVLRAKATGEPAFCMSIVGLFALRYALESSRRDAGIQEWLALGAPTTPEHVLLVSGTNQKLMII